MGFPCLTVITVLTHLLFCHAPQVRGHFFQRMIGVLASGSIGECKRLLADFVNSFGGSLMLCCSELGAYIRRKFVFRMGDTPFAGNRIRIFNT